MDKLPWLGASVKRKEDDRLLRGAARFLDDIEETLALHLAIGRCPYPHARIRRIDATRALEQPGVEAVLVGEEVVARTEPITVLRPFPGSAPTVFYGMADGVARYEGEPVVAVAAVDRYVAEDALELIDVDYEPLPHVVTVEDALRPGALAAPRHCAGKRRPRIDRARGRAGQAAGRRGRHRRRHVPDQPGERRADRDARRDRAVGGGHEHARAVGLHADAASLARPARALLAHGRDRRARDRAGRRGRLRPQDRRVPGGHHRGAARHRHAAPGEVDRGSHGVLPRRRPRARGRARADARGRPRRRAARAARPVRGRPRRLSRAAGTGAADQFHARRPVSPPRCRDPPARRADQQGAHGRVPRLRAGRVELRPRGARRPAGAPPRSGSRRLPAPQPPAARRAAVQERQRRDIRQRRLRARTRARALARGLRDVPRQAEGVATAGALRRRRHVVLRRAHRVSVVRVPRQARARASAPTRA